METSRRAFLRTLAVTGAAVGFGREIIGCASSETFMGSDSGRKDSGPSSGDASATCATRNINIAANHGHVLVLSQADVLAGAQKSYDIMGTAGHTHNVTVTAAQFGQLASGSMITLTTTTTNAHMHSITVMCA